MKPARPGRVLPTALIAVGIVLTAVFWILSTGQLSGRRLLILGLDNRNWRELSMFLGPVTVVVGMAIATARLDRSRRTEILAGFVGFTAFCLTCMIAIAGFWSLMWSGVFDRTEIALPEGGSIVVEEVDWHHCSMSVYQRDGIFIDQIEIKQARLPCGSLDPGQFWVTQDGHEATIRVGPAGMTVYLR